MHLLYYKKVKTFRTIKAHLKFTSMVGTGMGCRNRDHRMHSLVIKTFSSLHRLHFFSRGYPLLLRSINKIPRMADIVFSLHLSSPSFFASIAHHCYTEISSPPSSSSNTNCNVFQVSLPLRCHCARPSFARPTSHSLDVVGPCCFWKLPSGQRTPHVYLVTKYLCTSCPLAH